MDWARERDTLRQIEAEPSTFFFFLPKFPVGPTIAEPTITTTGRDLLLGTFLT